MTGLNSRSVFRLCSRGLWDDFPAVGLPSFGTSEIYSFLNGNPLQYSSLERMDGAWMEEPGRLQSMGSLRVRHD